MTKVKELPVGMSKQINGKNGYRLNRTVRGKEYNFGSFMNLDHALRQNGYIDIIVEDLRDAQSKEGLVSVDQVQKVLIENSLSDMKEITRLADDLYRRTQHEVRSAKWEVNSLKDEIEKLENKIDSIVTFMQLESQKTLWQRIRGR